MCNVQTIQVVMLLSAIYGKTGYLSDSTREHDRQAAALRSEEPDPRNPLSTLIVCPKVSLLSRFPTCLAIQRVTNRLGHWKESANALPCQSMIPLISQSVCLFQPASQSIACPTLQIFRI